MKNNLSPSEVRKRILAAEQAKVAKAQAHAHESTDSAPLAQPAPARVAVQLPARGQHTLTTIDDYSHSSEVREDPIDPTSSLPSPDKHGLNGSLESYLGPGRSFTGAYRELLEVMQEMNKLSEQANKIPTKGISSLFFGRRARHQALMDSIKEKNIQLCQTFNIPNTSKGFEISFDVAIAEKVFEFLKSGADAEGFLKEEGPEHWRVLKGAAFEGAVCALFRRRGVNARRTPSGPDGGVDVLVPIADKIYLIQCKGWKTPVGVKVVRELAGVITSRGADRHIGVVAATHGFTVDAFKFAHSANIRLWDTKTLIKIAQTWQVDGVSFKG